MSIYKSKYKNNKFDSAGQYFYVAMGEQWIISAASLAHTELTLSNGIPVDCMLVEETIIVEHVNQGSTSNYYVFGAMSSMSKDISRSEGYAYIMNESITDAFLYELLQEIQVNESWMRHFPEHVVPLLGILAGVTGTSNDRVGAHAIQKRDLKLKAGDQFHVDMGIVQPEATNNTVTINFYYIGKMLVENKLR